MQNSKIPLTIFKDHLKYKLTKFDEFGNHIISWLGYHAIFLKFNDGQYEAHRDVKDPSIGYCLGLDYDGVSFKWQTSEIKEVINVSVDSIEFKTTGSHYRLSKI